MSLAPGVRLGAYEVLAIIGAGGMGEVYRARDTRLGREVAVKVLPAALAGDPERLLRFEQEARAAAALNHPNILAVYDIGRHDGTPYIVSELLEGETLRERLTGGALPVRKATEYAIQMTHGLAAAHEKSIVHRDLKPDNIFVTADGRVKILDFGLAKLVHTETAMEGASDLPTTPPRTQDGMVLGTLGYMAPEQVRGIPADHRADIFAFGVVLYEMLAGRRAFQGPTAIDTMTAILKEDSEDLPIAERHIPPALEKIVDRCLEKMPAARFQTASDLGFALEALSTQSGHTEVAPTLPAVSKRRGPERLAWAAAGALVAAAIGLALMISLRTLPGVDASIRFTVSPPPKTTFVSGGGVSTIPVISPDGRRLLIAVFREGRSLLWVRSLDALEAQPLAGTEAAGSAFWAPDSRTIAFFQSGKLRTVDASGGPVQTVCDMPAPGGASGTWSQDGTIVFSSANAGLFKVPATGGQPVALAKPDASRRETSLRFPRFLPDGRGFLFLAWPTNTIWIGSLDGTETRKVLDADSQAQYSDGHLLFVRQGTLLAQPFDERRAAPSGDAVPIAEQVQSVGIANGSYAFSASERGVLAYREGASVPSTQMIWADRAGKQLGAVGQPGRYRNPALSPDGMRLALEVVDPTGRSEDIWLVELARGVMSRFTFDPANDLYPVWSPDGSRLMFSSDRQGGVFNLYQKMANGAGDDELVHKSNDGDKRPYSWSPDGRHVVYITYSPNASLGVLPLFGDRQPLKPPPGGFGTTLAQVSPDGRWMAYASTESGRLEVYVRSFPTPGGKWQISKDGAGSPRWRGDGRELFYYAADGQLVAVPIKAGGMALEVGTATPLFPPRVLNGPAYPNGFRAQYDVTRDGQRFLLNVPAEDATPPSITVVVNWPAALRK